MATLLVIQNFKSSINESTGKSSIKVSYSLVKALEFKEDHFARLLSVVGTKDVSLVFADFVQRQNVNGELEPYLGSSEGENTWVPLANNTIPSFGLVQIHHHNQTELPTSRKITVVIEIASRSWINGA